MEKRTFQIVAVVAAVVFFGTVGVTVLATGDDAPGHRTGFMAHLHQMIEHLHGGGHHQDPMSQLVDDLELSPSQQQHFERMHEILSSRGENPDAMLELHNKLVEQFRAGRIESRDIRRMIDDHVEQMRETAYEVTDELVALVNGLDATQREILLRHLQGAPREAHGH